MEITVNKKTITSFFNKAIENLFIEAYGNETE